MVVPGQLSYVRRLGATSRLALWSALAAAVIWMDVRVGALEGVRGALALAVSPVQHAMRVPADLAREIAGFLTRHHALQRERDALLAERARYRLVEQAADELSRENAELRALLRQAQRREIAALTAGRLFQGRDWFSQTLILDRGASAGVRAGMPVIDGEGLLGQITRVYATQSELTLVASAEQLTPVMNARTGQRGLAAGLGNGRMELRFMPSQSDVVEGDVLLTSGLDGIYPAGLPVATVTRIGRPSASPYLRIDCVPVAGIDRSRQVLVLQLPASREQP